MSATADDYRYIIRLIQFGERSCGMRFFITVSDFDTLYHWYEKRIPAALVEEAIARVAERFRAKDKPITTFRQFAGEVRKAHRALGDLQIGAQAMAAQPVARRYLVNFPAELAAEREQLQEMLRLHEAGQAVDPAPVLARVVDFYAADAELAARCAHFMGNLAAPLRRPEIERQYRLNYLMHRLGIPDFS
jgi:hypothetical protein